MNELKVAAALGSGLPDATKSTAATQPAAPLAVENKPAPGQTGPRGLAPRTTYSRVNTGAPQTPDIGSHQKAISPRGLESLPKLAHQEISMNTMMKRPLLQDLVKVAMEGTASKVDITAEAVHQLSYLGEQHTVLQTKTAAAESEIPHVPTEYVTKLASALDYLAKEAANPGSADAASPGVGPGQGPGALEVSSSRAGGNNYDNVGQATAAHQPPMNPPLMKTDEQSGDPGNALQTDDNHAPGGKTAALEQKNLEALSKIAFFPITGGIGALAGAASAPQGQGLEGAVRGGLGAGVGSTLGAGAGALGGAALGGGLGYLVGGGPGAAIGSGVLGTTGLLAGGAGGALGGYQLAMNPLLQRQLAAEQQAEQQAAAPPEAGTRKQAASSLVEKNLAALGLSKIAEDAINPAHISAGPAVPPDTSSSGEPGGAPVGGMPQGATSLIASNEAAINFTRREAKAGVKSDLREFVTEPALSASTDKVLAEAFDATERSGAKIASEQHTKVAAARALLATLVKEAAADCATPKKEKAATLGGAAMSKGPNPSLATPSGQSGFSAG